MTSNQLKYWDIEEQKRSNMAKERETRRHNIRQETLDSVKNDLEAQGLKIKSQEQLIKAADMFQKYGVNSYASLPSDAKEKLSDIIGHSANDSGGTAKEIASGVVGDAMRWVFGNRGVSGFF